MFFSFDKEKNQKKTLGKTAFFLSLNLNAAALMSRRFYIEIY